MSENSSAQQNSNQQQTPLTNLTNWEVTQTTNTIARKQNNILGTYTDGSRQRYITIVPYDCSNYEDDLYLFTLFKSNEPYSIPYRRTTAIRETPTLTDGVIEELC